MESAKKGCCHTLPEKIRTKILFSKKLKVEEIKYCDKSENRFSREEKVVKVARFLLQQLIPATFSYRDFFFL